MIKFISSAKYLQSKVVSFIKRLKKFKKTGGLLLFTGVVCLFAVKSFATFPQQINYQGKLTNASNIPVADGNYSILFSIYNVSSGGSDLWNETQNVTTESGFFNVILGSTTSIETSVFDGNDRWLGIAVEGDAEMTPRQKLTSVGHAFHAYNADKLDGQDGSYYATASPSGVYVQLGPGTQQTTAGATAVWVSGSSTGVSAEGTDYGVWARSDTTAVYGEIDASNYGALGKYYKMGQYYGVYGESSTAYGVYGKFDDNNIGYMGSNGTGVYGQGASNGIWGTDGINNGYLGRLDYNAGVWGQGTSYGVYGTTGSIYGYLGGTEGVKGYYDSNHYGSIGSSLEGVYGYANDAASYALRVEQVDASGYAIYASGGKNYMSGQLTVANTIESSAGGFKFPDGTTQTTASTGGGDYVLKAGDTMTGTLTNTATVALRADGGILVGNGAYDTPSLAFKNDSDTGFYSGGPNQINVSLGGSAYMRFSDAYFQSDTLAAMGANSISLKGLTVDGASAIGVKIGNENALAASGAKIASFYSDNFSTEKAYINKDGKFVGQALESTVSTGTAPLTVASSTCVTNLNADYLDGYNASDFGAMLNGYVKLGPSSQQTTGSANGVWVNGATTGISGEGTTYGVYGKASTYGIYGLGKYGIQGVNSTSTARFGYLGGSSYGAYGTNDGTILGYLGSANYGAYGQYSGTQYGYLGGSSYGVYGTDGIRIGYLGDANYGAYGQYDANNYGVLGRSGMGVYGKGTYGVSGEGTTYGVYGLYSATQYGYLGGASYGAYGCGTTGVYGTDGTRIGYLADASYGAYGQYSSTIKGYLGSGNYGAYGQYNTSNYAKIGGSNFGVSAEGATYGVYASILSVSQIGSLGYNVSPYAAVYGSAGYAGDSGGYFLATTANTTGYGVRGVAAATSGLNYGVRGDTSSTAGWGGYFTGGYGLYGSQASIGSTTAGPANGLYVNGSVGIGDATPTGALQVAGDEVRIGTAGTVNYALGDGQLYVQSSLEVDGQILSIGTYNTTTATAANMYIDSVGRFYRSTSSKKYKTDIKEYDINTNKLLCLKPVRFKMNDNTAMPGKEDFGLIAEDVYQVFPELVELGPDGSPEGLQYSKLSVILLKGYQEQQKQIEELKNEIKALKQERKIAEEKDLPISMVNP